jgi:hypothetical protein
LTTLIRDIHLTYPGQFELDVDTTCGDLWRHNPHITRLWNHNTKKPQLTKPKTTFLKLTYGEGIRVQNTETVHMAAYFHRNFKKQTGIDVPVQLPYGDLHLSEEEKTVPLVTGRNWVVLSGGKTDATVKVWRPDYFQSVTDGLLAMGLGVVQAGGNDSGHWHPELKGALNLVGQTNLRDFIRLIYHADGVICGVTAAMHIAAALGKPCVTIGGGREAWWWEAYVNENSGFGPVASGNIPMPHEYLHTIGLMDCCRHHGCWKNKVIPLNNDKLLCKRPIYLPGQAVAECMNIITPELVLESVMKYYKDQSLPPINIAPAIVPDLLTATEPAKTQAAAAETCAAPATGKKTCGRGKSHKTSARASVKIPHGAKISINPRGKLETRGKNAKQGVANRPGGVREHSDETIFDHADIGGKFTVCILFYGPEEYFDLHKRCLESVIATVPRDRMDLRVASNALNQKSLDLIEGYTASGVITKHYRHQENAYKYPVMREMFNDPECPINTKWVLWFDDDTICDVDPNWAFILTQHMINHHRKDNAHMFGAKFVWTTTKKQREILSARPWHKGRPWRLHNDKPSPNGTKIIFTAGGFWAISKECIEKANIPDLGTGLTHTGGDWQIGEQVYQAGFMVKQFNGSKQFVRTSSVDRRGVTMPKIDEVKGHTLGKPDDLPPTPPKLPPPQRVTASRVMELPPLSQTVAVPPPPRPPRAPKSNVPRLIQL